MLAMPKRLSTPMKTTCSEPLILLPISCTGWKEAGNELTGLLRQSVAGRAGPAVWPLRRRSLRARLPEKARRPRRIERKDHRSGRVAADLAGRHEPSACWAGNPNGIHPHSVLQNKMLVLRFLSKRNRAGGRRRIRSLSRRRTGTICRQPPPAGRFDPCRLHRRRHADIAVAG